MKAIRNTLIIEGSVYSIFFVGAFILRLLWEGPCGFSDYFLIPAAIYICVLDRFFFHQVKNFFAKKYPTIYEKNYNRLFARLQICLEHGDGKTRPNLITRWVLPKKIAIPEKNQLEKYVEIDLVLKMIMFCLAAGMTFFSFAYSAYMG